MQTNTQLNAQKSISAQLRHGHIPTPASRAYFAWQDNKLDAGQLNQCEAGKFFPETQPGLKDSFAPDDSVNSAPPADGSIASAGQSGMGFLDEAGDHWKKHDVKSGADFNITWSFTANHVTRRFNYFMTKENWNPQEVLSRAQFEDKPFNMVQNELQPFWQFADELKPANPTAHNFKLPNRKGYHVLLAVWEVADTGNAFYQVIDLNFEDDGSVEQRPETPSTFTAIDVTEKSVSLGWKMEAASNIKAFKIVRDNKVTFDIPSTELVFTDTTVTSGTTYNYYILAVDHAGIESLPSASIQVTTPNDAGGHVPPTAPKTLHTMEINAHDVDLMWGESTSSTPIKQYHVYRDGVVIKSTAELDYKDVGLEAATKYQYFVAAETIDGEFSVPSNVIFITTQEDSSSGEAEWAINVTYRIGDIVSYENKTYKCIQAHTSNIAWTPDATLALWNVIS